MTTSVVDYLLEDTTGSITETNFCDIHDRRFLRVHKTLVRTDHVAVQVFDLGKVSPAAIAGADYHSLSRAVLIFPNPASASKLGTVQYSLWEEAIPVEEYLRKPFLSSRTFIMSDRQNYKWSRGSITDREWTCTNAQGYLVAHYDRKPGGEPEYRNSTGNVLTICQSFSHLAVEIVTSLTLMRHIAQVT